MERRTESDRQHDWALTNPAPRKLTQSAHILVADDHRQMRELVAEALRNDGYTVFEARTGGELLKLLAESELDRKPCFDLIVTDHRMPVATGLDIASSMFQCGWKVPVILMTAFGDAELHGEAAHNGVAAVFNKPFELLNMRTAVRMILSDPRHPRRPRRVEDRKESK